jgi:hypothetical protein
MTYPTKLPKKKYWYHGTTRDRAKQIIDSGFLKDMSFGLYFANRSDYASTFAHMRDWTHSQPIAVFKIPTKRIPNILLGIDHDPKYFPSDLITAVSFDCEITISEKDIQGWYEYPKKEAAE